VFNTFVQNHFYEASTSVRELGPHILNTKMWPPLHFCGAPAPQELVWSQMGPSSRTLQQCF